MRARTLLRIWVPVALLVALSVAAAFVYVGVAPKRYAARAEVLVLPVPASDMRYQGLPVLRDEGGHAAVQTAAKLVATSALADAVRARLGLGETSAELLSRVTVGPSGNSSTLSIRASASSAALAARIANAFADLLLAVRTATLNGAIADATARTTQTLAALPPSDPQVPALRARLASLDALHGSTDPSLQVAGRATPPKQPTSPPRTAILLGALLGSLLLGTAAGLAATWRRWKEAYDRAVSERMAAE